MLTIPSSRGHDLSLPALATGAEFGGQLLVQRGGAKRKANSGTIEECTGQQVLEREGSGG